MLPNNSHNDGFNVPKENLPDHLKEMPLLIKKKSDEFGNFNKS